MPARPKALAAPPPPDPRILVVGDSVLLGARDDIVARLAGWNVTVDAEVSRSTVGGLEALRRDRASIGDLVVVHLGHNDGASRELFRRRIDEIMSDLSGVEHVIWLNLAEFDDWVRGANDELAAASARWANLEIADWSSVAASDPAYLYSDGLHLPPPGREAIAGLIGARVDAWAVSRGPAELLSLRFRSGAGSALPRPAPAGVLAGPPAFVTATAAGWLAGDRQGDIVGSDGRASGLDPSNTGSVIGLATTSDGRGYWLVTDSGTVTAHGSAGQYGDTGSLTLSAPIVGMAATPSGRGYWLGAADGGVFAFGDAAFYGAASDVPGTSVVGIAARPDGRGYWLATADGGVLPFGDAKSYGDASTQRLEAPVVAITTTRSGDGYWLLGADGGVFAFGDAGFYGSAANVGARAAGLVASSDGYTVVTWRPTRH